MGRREGGKGIQNFFLYNITSKIQNRQVSLDILKGERKRERPRERERVRGRRLSDSFSI
jgi:hypothetical protein